MKAKDVLYIAQTVENEGFDYAFVNYSAFDDIKDEEFHALRKAYLAARNNLALYIGMDKEVQPL
jgi:hypothetical protein